MDFGSIRSAARNSIGSLPLPEEFSAVNPGLSPAALENMLAAFAGAFTQDNRFFTLRIGDGKTFGERLLPQSVEGTEALSSCYKYVVTCLSPDAFIPLGAASPAKTGNEETANESNISWK